MSLPHFDALYVVSDLHLGGGPSKERQIFNQGQLLADTILHLTTAEASKHVALVLNGDIVDFLAEKDAKVFDPEGAVGKLDRIMKDGSFRKVFEALRCFVKAARRTLVLVLGNHDVELALPGPRDHLVSYLCDGDAAARGRIELALDGAGWQAMVGTARVLCVHGNDEDPWNRVDHEAVRTAAAQMARRERVTASPDVAGSRLVVNVMNDIKMTKAWVDVLKPEDAAVVNLLLWIDPSVVGKIWGVLDAYGRRGLSWPQGGSGLLGGNGRSRVRERNFPGASYLLDETLRPSMAALGIGDGHDVEALWQEAERSYREGHLPSLRASAGDDQPETLGHGTMAVSRFILRLPDVERYRRALASWLKNDSAFELESPDLYYKEVDGRIGTDVDFVVAGHTHLERAIRRTEGGMYYNSGTWTRLIRLQKRQLEPPHSPAAPNPFEPVYKALRSGSMAALDRGIARTYPTVVRIARGTDGNTAGELTRATRKGKGIVLTPVRGTQHRVVRP